MPCTVLEHLRLCANSDLLILHSCYVCKTHMKPLRNIEGNIYPDNMHTFDIYCIKKKASSWKLEEEFGGQSIIICTLYIHMYVKCHNKVKQSINL